MEYLQLLDRTVFPISKFDKITKPAEIIYVELTTNSFGSDELYEELQDEIKYRKIDKSIYNNVITFAASPSYMELNTLKLYINGIQAQYYDIKWFLLHGYLYIFHKDDFTIEDVFFIRKDNNVDIVESNNTMITKYNDKIKNRVRLSLLDDKYPDFGVDITKGLPYLILNDYESVFDVYLNSDGMKFMDKVFENKIKYIYIYNEYTGFSDDISKLEIYPFHIRNVSEDENDKIIIVYEELDPIIYNRNLYQKELTHLLSTTKALFYYVDNIANIGIQYEDVRYPIPKSDKEAIFFTRDFRWDLYNEIQKEYFSGTLSVEPILTPFSDSLVSVDTSIYGIGTAKGNFYAFRIPNPYGMYPEIYIKGRLVNTYRLDDFSMGLSSVYMKADIINEKYYAGQRDGKNDVFIVLRPKDYTSRTYTNITQDYNGVVPIGKDWFTGNFNKIYLDGYKLKETDLAFNTIPPYNLLCTFPRRKYKDYNIINTKSKTHYGFSKSLKVKYKNHTQEEIDEIYDNPEKYIYKGYLFMDYVDHNYIFSIGPYMLHEGIDYIIISPNLVKFINTIYIYPEDDITSDYLDLSVENHMYELDYIEDLKERAFKSSKMYTLTTNREFMDVVFKAIDNDIEVSNDKQDICSSCPVLYDDTVFKNHMYLTKYFSSEVILTGENDNPYGDKWLNNLENEFPEFIDENGIIITDFDYPDNITIEDFPRLVRLPEFDPLNVVIGDDIIAKRKLRQLNLNLPSIYYNGNELNNKLFDKKTYMEGIPEIFHTGDILYNKNIPFDAVYDFEKEE